MSRPPTGNGGSRPPTSRFQEGSMNDRVSAVPPPQFLGPEQLKEYEKQFYTAPMAKAATTTTHRDSRKKHRERPLSESQSLKSQSPKSPLSSVSAQDRDQRFVTHKKSNGFFSRIRDVLFSNRASGAQAQAQPPSHKQQEAIRKHTSLQEPLLAQRTGQLHPLAQHYTDMHVPQPPGGDNITSRNGAALDRPTREEVMQSYNQLMASGFFKAHAIQSTRHARPPTVPPPMPMPMPSIASAPGSPEPPPRISSINAVTMKSKSPPPSSPNSVRSRYSLHISPQLANANMSSRSTPDAKAESRRGLGHVPPAKEPRHALRGRKRNRADTDETSQSSTGASSGMPLSPTLAAATFAQPFKRVAKKLRKMPSSPASSDSKLNAATPPRPATSATTSDMQTADGVVRLAASISNGGTVYHDERALRLRSPSPAPAKTAANADAKTNGNVKSSRVTRSMAAPQKMASGNKLRKRAKSPALRPRSSGAPYLDHVNQFETREPVGQRPLSASNQAKASCQDRHTDSDSEVPSSPMPLSVIPDVNRGIPSVPRIPDQYARVPNRLSKAGGRGRHSWLKARQLTDENYSDFDSHRMDVDVEGGAKWQVGEAL
ncbi:hypothetical protein F4775DRAFT_356320 [Biscogniauxia sp. FL1348]|nr:hypothetical protein F4775DRAFT_356320 [Biscogniauxia sp. FL1348]